MIELTEEEKKVILDIAMRVGNDISGDVLQFYTDIVNGVVLVINPCGGTGDGK